MKTQLLICLFAFLAFTPCHARIGDTRDEIESRYGAPKSKIDKLPPGVFGFVFFYKGFHINVHFLNGRSQWEEYIKADGKKFTETELELLLSANSGGRVWVRTDKPTDDARKWSLGDEATATLGPTKLTVATTKYVGEVLGGLLTELLKPPGDKTKPARGDF